MDVFIYHTGNRLYDRGPQTGDRLVNNLISRRKLHHWRFLVMSILLCQMAVQDDS
ncbi:hypothetical protein [Gracilimonas sp.]|uniref:hypothetical protein n=1 Tax=Gracilimonas sp. TaxID=1974203 RepID=UPI0025BC77E3|nr:hypothetical protein [Gracilimonas sp.]